MKTPFSWPKKGPKDPQFFVGIDLGGKTKRTTGLCIFEGKEKKIIFLKDVKGYQILPCLKPYFFWTKVIAIDAPLTSGKGKGKMRLYEKFLSRKIFRQERILPIPPALMPELVLAGKDLVESLRNVGFSLDINLTETFPTLVKKITKKDFIFRVLGGVTKKIKTFSSHQESALICSAIAYLHSAFKTRYLGYKDGFLFLPEMSFWKKEWQEKFYRSWKEKPYLKYRYLKTNLFEKIQPNT